MDTDQSNHLTFDEFSHAMFALLGFTGSRATVREIYDHIDADRSAKIGFDELNAWLKGRRTLVAARSLGAKQLSFGERADSDDVEWDEGR